MIQNPRQQANRGTAEDRKTVYRTIQTFGIVDIILGISLLTCGGLSIYYTGDGHSYGPPFFVGSFIAGVFFSLKGILYISWAINKTKSAIGEESCCTQFTPCLCASCMFCFMGCIFGFQFVGMSGIFETCGSKSYRRRQECYNNQEEKRYIAIAIVGLLACCVLLLITVVSYMCCNKKFSTVAAVATRQRNTIVPGRQMQIQNTQLELRNQMLMQQYAASQDPMFAGHHPVSQPHGGIQHYPQGYSQLRQTSTHFQNTGYPSGQSSPYRLSHYGDPTAPNQVHGPYTYNNSPPRSYPGNYSPNPTAPLEEHVFNPSAPPPSYDEIMKK